MMDSGYDLDTLRFISTDKYTIPEIEAGEGFVNFFLNNQTTVEDHGLSLFIFSNQKGLGKTTLAHYLVYQIAFYYMQTGSNPTYSRHRTFAFERASEFARTDNFQRQRSSYYVLDDLGAESRASQWKIDDFQERFLDMVHYRRNRNLTTLITTNYDPESLSNLYGGVFDSLLEIKADGTIGGSKFRQIEVGGGEDLRLASSGGWGDAESDG